MEAVGAFTPNGSQVRLKLGLPGPGDYEAVDISVEPDGGSRATQGRASRAADSTSLVTRNCVEDSRGTHVRRRPRGTGPTAVTTSRGEGGVGSDLKSPWPEGADRRGKSA